MPADEQSPGRAWQANPYMQRVGRRVAEARTAAGMSQERLGALIGVGRSSVANMEGGRQSVDAVQLALIARALRVSLDGLLPADDLPPEPALPHDVVIERAWRVTCRTCAGHEAVTYRERELAAKARDEHIAEMARNSEGAAGYEPLPPLPDGEVPGG